MPYKSEKQRKFFHTKIAKKKGITAKIVKEFDKASKGRKLPSKLPIKKDNALDMLRRGMSGSKK